MNTSQPGMPTYGVPEPTRPERLPWPRVIVRMVLVTLPAVLVGSFIGSIIVTVLGVQVLRDQPVLSGVIPVMAGLIAGVGLGFLLKPGRTQLFRFSLVALGVGIAAFFLLFALAQLRAPDMAPAVPPSTYLTGPLIVGLVEGVVAFGLWRLRLRHAHP